MSLEKFRRKNPEEYARAVAAMRTNPRAYKVNTALPIDVQVFLQLRALGAILGHKRRMRGKYAHTHKNRRLRSHPVLCSTLELPCPLSAARKVRIAFTKRIEKHRKKWDAQRASQDSSTSATATSTPTVVTAQSL